MLPPLPTPPYPRISLYLTKSHFLLSRGAPDVRHSRGLRVAPDGGRESAATGLPAGKARVVGIAGLR